MKRIISLILTLCLISTLAPVTIYAAEDPEYTGGTLIADYTLNEDFAESYLGSKVIYEKESDKFDVTYTPEGTVVTRTTDTVDMSTNIIDTIVLRLVSNSEDFVNRTETYQTGFSGVYAFEFTFNADLNVEGTTSGRTDFYFGNALDGGRPSQHNIRLDSKGSFMCSTGPRFSTYSKGTDRTIRIVVDTVNKKMYGYDVDASVSPCVYIYRGEGEYVQDAITSMMYSLREFIANGSSVTFKNFKVYEIYRDERSAGNMAISSLDAKLVDQPSAVTENITIPAAWAENGYTVVSSDKSVLSTSGMITRGEEDKEVSLTVSGENSGCYFERIYNFTVKAAAKTSADLDAISLPASGSIITEKYINLPTYGSLYNSVFTWSSSNPEVISESGVIKIPAEDTEVALTVIAENDGMAESRTFYYIIKGRDSIEDVLARITPESITNQNPEMLVADIYLPSVTEEGYYVKWDSLNDNIMSDDGKINKSINILDDTPVVFNVEVSDGSESASKHIYFKIAKRGIDVAFDCSTLPEGVENVVTYEATVANKDGNVYLLDENDNKIVGVKVAKSRLSLEYWDEEQEVMTINGNQFELKVVMSFREGCASIYVDEVLVADFVPYIQSAINFKRVSEVKDLYYEVVEDGYHIYDRNDPLYHIYQYEPYIPHKDMSYAQNALLQIAELSKVYSASSIVLSEKVILDEYSLFNYNIKLFDYFEYEEMPYITKNMILKTDSIGGVNVEWFSSDNSILSADGVFNAPDKVSFLDVGIRLTSERTGASSNLTMRRIAIPVEELNLLSGAKVYTGGMIFNDGNYEGNIVDNDLSTYIKADKGLGGFIIVDMGDLKDINSLYFFQSPEDNGIVSCDIYLGEDTEWSTDELVASPVFINLESNLVEFDVKSARYIRIDNIQTSYGVVKLNELKGYLFHDSADRAYYDILAIDMPEDYLLKIKDLEFPSVGAVYGSTLVWTSSRPDVISTDGKIAETKVATEVVLTVTAMYEGATATKSYTYLVSPTPTSGGGSGGGGGSSDIIEEDTVHFKVNSTTGVIGRTVTVPVEIKNNPGIVSAHLEISYDNNWLTLTEVSDKGIIGNENHSDDYSVVPYILSWENDTAKEAFTDNGKIVELTFAVADNAPVGEYDIMISYDEVLDLDGEFVDFKIANGIIDVKDHIIGDVNDDGEVDTKDRMTISRHLASWIGYDVINESAADVNCDGKVDTKDRMALSRHLAGWIGYETLPYVK